MTHVLLVDDDPLMCDLMAMVLHHEDYTVRVINRDFADLCHPSCHAWADVDVLLCDLYLNDIVTGIDILAVAKHDHPRIRRVALSGATVEDLNALAEVADIVMRKPVNPLDVVAALQ